MLERIDHWVVLMFENRSFDSLLGHLPHIDRAESLIGREIELPSPVGPVRVAPTDDMRAPLPDPGERLRLKSRRAEISAIGPAQRAPAAAPQLLPGEPSGAMPEVRMEVRFEATPQGSRFVMNSTFASVEAMEQLISMGMQEGLKSALGQFDALLADLRALSAGVGTALEMLDDTHVRVVREVRGTLAQVWRCHTEAALMQRWMLGPPGWTMPVCQVATEVGQKYRYEWANTTGGERFGFEGELLESEKPRRAVTTERMIGMEGPGTVNELVLRPRPGGRTAIELVITYPSRELRDMVLATGMVDGMEASYARLETEVVASLA